MTDLFALRDEVARLIEAARAPGLSEAAESDASDAVKAARAALSDAVCAGAKSHGAGPLVGMLQPYTVSNEERVGYEIGCPALAPYDVTGADSKIYTQSARAFGVTRDEAVANWNAGPLAPNAPAGKPGWRRPKLKPVDGPQIA